MMLLEKYSPVLRMKSESFDMSDKESVTRVFNMLKSLMIARKGIGLSAPQIGISSRAFVMGNPEDPKNIIGVFNPKIIDYFGKEVEYEEGCLTFPGVYCKITRMSGIKVRYTTMNGVTDTIKFDGMTSRIFQHEYDHLEGILMKDKVSRLVWERANKANGK